MSQKVKFTPRRGASKGTKCQNRTLDPLKCIEIIFMINQDQFKNGCDEIYTIGYYSGVYSSLKDENVMKSIQLAIIRAFTAL